MQKSPALGAVVVALVLAIVAGGIWLLGGDGIRPTPDLPHADATGEGDTRGGTRIADASGTRDDGPTTDSGRTSIETGAAPSALVGSALKLTGAVVDQAGNPIAGATVRATPNLDGRSARRNQFDFEADGINAWADQMRAMRRTRAEATTDGQGTFELVVLGDSRTIDLRVLARGYAQLQQNVDRPADDNRDLGALQLKRGAIVSGRVIDQGGAPIVQAQVSRLDNGGWGFEALADQFAIEFADFSDLGQSTVTDAEGRFEFAHFVPGKFGLRAKHADHPTAKSEGMSVEVGVTLADVTIVVEPGTTIRGTLLGKPERVKGLRIVAAQPRDRNRTQNNDDNGQGIAVVFGNAGDVSFGGNESGVGPTERSVEVEPDGSFALRGLAVGRTYRVWATQAPEQIWFGNGPACSAQVDVVSGTSNVELRYEAGVDVTFTVVADEGGRPIESLSVRNRLVDPGNRNDNWFDFNPGNRMRSYPGGKVTLTNLRPKAKQQLELTIESIGFATLERKGIGVPTSGTIDLGTLRLAPAPVVRVEVLDADGKPVEGANVQLKVDAPAGNPRDPGDVASAWQRYGGQQRRATTDEDGKCTINAVANAPIRINVHSEDFAPYASEPMTSDAVRGLDHVVHLLRGGRVDVTVLDPDGHPVPETTVDHRSPDQDRSAQKTDKLGVATFERLAPGSHDFRIGTRIAGAAMVNGPSFQLVEASSGGATPEDWTPVVVVDGVTASLQLDKEATGSLEGVVREAGVPLANARITFVPGVEDPPADGPSAPRMGGRGSSTRTDENGHYELKNLAPGEHRLRITHKDRTMPTEVRVGLQAGANTFDVELDATLVRGVVRGPDGRPVAGARVGVAGNSSPSDSNPFMVVDGMIRGTNGSSTTTDADGRYELRGVQGGTTIQVVASAEGFAAGRSADCVTRAGQMTEGIDIHLGPAGAVKVSSTQEHRFAMVEARWEGPATDAVPSVRNAIRRDSITLDGLRPGRWKIVLTPMGSDGQSPHEQIVDVVAGETLDVRF